MPRRFFPYEMESRDKDRNLVTIPRHLGSSSALRDRDAPSSDEMIRQYVSATMKPVLLDQAHALRVRADRTRRLAKSIDDSEASMAILRYAEELERRAAALEAQTHERSFESERPPACEVTPG